MPVVSVIVPVYDVEAYLAQCVDSILGQSFTDLELIAVNDCSPDSSLSILRAYAERDPRLKIVDLTSNVGLGEARNVGLDAAQGEFVWFVDSDDWIADASVEAAVNRARETNAEVVIAGWSRNFEDGDVQPGTGMSILSNAPDVFRVAEYPSIFNVLQIACNKLIRRDFLQRTGLRFAPGWYEDTPFTYPLLAAASRITTIPAVILHYRQRASSITGTHSTRHMELLTQWDLAMESIGRFSDRPDELRQRLFPLMIKHCSRVLVKYQRLPRDSQRDYARALSKLYRRYRPGGRSTCSSRMEQLQHLLVSLGNVRLLKLQWRTMRFLHGKPHSSRRAVKQAANPPMYSAPPRAERAARGRHISATGGATNRKIQRTGLS